jgi:hypothetical protein
MATKRTPTSPDAPAPSPRIYDCPDDWPKGADGAPLDYEDMSQEQAEECLQKFGSMDVASLRATTSVNTRLREFMDGKTVTQTPWAARDSTKYDACMGVVGNNSNTYLYLEQTRPMAAKLAGPAPQSVPTYEELHRWLVENVWDGQARTYAWTIRNGNRQVATGNLALMEDLAHQARYKRRIRELNRDEFGPAPFAPAPPPAVAPAPPPPPPPRERELPLYAGASLEAERIRMEREFQERIQATRAQMEREYQERREAERREAERQTFLNQINALSEEVKSLRTNPSQAADPRVDALQRRIEEMAVKSPVLALTAPAPTAPPAHLAAAPPEPPDNFPEPPAGFALTWDFRARRWGYQPLASAQAPAPAATVGNPPAVAIVQQPSSLVDMIDQVTDQATKTRTAVGRLVKAGFIPGVELSDFGPPPKNNVAAEMGPPPAAVVPAAPEEPKPPKAFIDEGGLTFRTDKNGKAITDDLGMVDLLTNGGKLGEAIDFFREMTKKRELDTVEVAKAKAEAEKIKAEAEKAQAEKTRAEAEAKKAQAEAYEAQARAVLAQQQAVGVLPSGADVSSDHEPPPELR